MGRIDLPTRRLDPSELAKIARELDRSMQNGAGPDPESCARLARASSPDLTPELEPDLTPQLTVDSIEIDLATLEPEGSSDATPRQSETRIAAMVDDPWLDRVPVLVASRDDLSWFTLDDGAHLVLDRIDGTASVRAIMEHLSLPRETTLGLLRELEAHQVVAIE